MQINFIPFFHTPVSFCVAVTKYLIEATLRIKVLFWLTVSKGLVHCSREDLAWWFSLWWWEHVVTAVHLVMAQEVEVGTRTRVDSKALPYQPASAS